MSFAEVLACWLLVTMMPSRARVMASATNIDKGILPRQLLETSSAAPQPEIVPATVRVAGLAMSAKSPTVLTLMAIAAARWVLPDVPTMVST